MHTILKSEKKEVVIGFDKPFVIIGEKLNPTGIKKLGQALVDRNMDYVKHLAKRQVDWGADVLDVNVGHPQIEEAEVMPLVVEAVQSVVDVPLCIDSNEPKILEAGLNAIKGGKPLVNSVNGEEKQLSTVLPIVKARGAAVIGLTIGDEGIPPTPEGRLAAAAKIIAIVEVRLINKKTQTPVPDAVIFAKRIDMAPDNMASMDSPLEPLPSTQPGVYRFKTNLSMAGGWRLSLGAKVQGEEGTVESKLILKALP